MIRSEKQKSSRLQFNDTIRKLSLEERKEKEKDNFLYLELVLYNRR